MALVSAAHHAISIARYRCQVKTLSNLILRLLLVSSLFYFFSYPEVDPDLWGHLFFGREILREHSLLLQNLYSYTAPGYPWINHEWLAEIIFYAVYRLFGSPGLILLKTSVGAGIVWLLDQIMKRRGASLLIRAISLIWVMALLSPGFNIRPQIFTYFLFALLLFLFCLYEDGKKTALYGAPFLMLLWVNLHGGFLAGVGSLGLFSIWSAVTGLWNQGKKPAVFTRAFILLTLTGVALLFNPFGVGLLSFLARDLLVERSITEWQPIPMLDLSFLEFKLAVLFIALFSVRSASLRRWDFILAVVAAIFAFRYQRHTPLFAIAAAPFLAAAVERLIRKLKDGTRKWVLVSCTLTIAVYQFYSISEIHLQHRAQLIVNPAEYPTQAADFMARNRIRGNLVLPFDWGEYFIWKLYPEVRVSIDGRYTTAYPMEAIQEHWEWMEGKQGWRKLLEAYPAEIAITNRHHPITELLRKDPEWVYIYSDPIAFIFVRKISSQQELLDKFKEKRLLPPRVPQIYFPG